MKQVPGRRQSFELLCKILRGDQLEPMPGWQKPQLWHALLPIADAHGVTPALPQALRRQSVWDRLPKEVADLLDAIHCLNFDRNRAIETQGLAIVATVGQAGLTAIPLKGLAYQFIGLYADPGQRSTGDIDILVPPKDAARVQEVLIAEGYRPAEGYHDHAHHLHPLAPDPAVHGPCCIDVHFQISSSADVNDLLPAASVQTGSVKIETQGQVVAVPKTADLIDHAVLHGAIHHHGVSEPRIFLKEVLDVGRLWSRARAEGMAISDLRLTRNGEASQHFGACLLLGGVSAHELGSLRRPAQRHLARVLRYEGFPQLRDIQRALASNAALLRADPRGFVAKYLTVQPYRTLLSLIKK